MTRHLASGYAIRCSIRGCRQRTDEQAGHRWPNAPAAVHAARLLLWLPTHAHRWVCPMHQLWDYRTGRWVTPDRAEAIDRARRAA